MGDEPIGDSFSIKGEVTKVDLGALPGAPQLKFVVMVDKTAFEVFVCERLGHDPETVGAACTIVTASFMQGAPVDVAYYQKGEINVLRTVILGAK